MMVKMHKLDGYVTCQIYIAVALLSLSNGGFRLWPVIGWVAGLALIIVKIIAVRNKSISNMPAGWNYAVPGVVVYYLSAHNVVDAENA